MRLLLIALLFLAGCTQNHRLLVLYESGDAAAKTDAELLLNLERKEDG